MHLRRFCHWKAFLHSTRGLGGIRPPLILAAVYSSRSYKRTFSTCMLCISTCEPIAALASALHILLHKHCLSHILTEAQPALPSLRISRVYSALPSGESVTIRQTVNFPSFGNPHSPYGRYGLDVPVSEDTGQSQRSGKIRT